jgi:hypothetical protein
LRPDDGVLELTVPTAADRAATFEDPDATTEARRLELFGQYDHLRIFGADFKDTLTAAGFSVDVADGAKLPAKIMTSEIGPAYYDDNRAYICRKAQL